MLAILFPHISPIAFSIGPFAIYWYALAYLFGIVAGYFIITMVNNKFVLVPSKSLDDLIFYVVVGIIIGGRLGYVIFYDPIKYLSDPLDIIMIRKGGMSFHGGLVGVAASLYMLARKYNCRYLTWTDLIALVAPIGIFFGRIANFINGELYGRITESAVGVLFREQEVGRHPSQLYEAFLEGLLCFIILFYAAIYRKKVFDTGFTTGLFLIVYSLARILCEFFREPDTQIGFIFNYFSMGQLLCLPLLLVGVYLIRGSRAPKIM